MPLRILAFSDLHRNSSRAEEILLASRDADVVVGAGDFATQGIGLTDTAGILRDLAVPAVFVAGNHDVLSDLRDAFGGGGTIHILHGDSLVIGGVPFFGLGYGIPVGGDEPWNLQLDEAEAVPLLEDCPQGAVLVTHSPPFGIADVQRTGAHVGSSAVRDAVVRAPAASTSVRSYSSRMGHIWNARRLSRPQSRPDIELVYSRVN